MGQALCFQPAQNAAAAAAFSNEPPIVKCQHFSRGRARGTRPARVCSHISGTQCTSDPVN